jgi:CO/xanthine dehydrogenase Mo-binding subunit
LVEDRVRWVGDYVAFVVAETVHQAADAAELIAVKYERFRRSSRPPMQSSAARRASGRIILTISLYVYLKGRQGGDRPPPSPKPRIRRTF